MCSRKTLVAVLVLLGWQISARDGRGQKFLPDDPVWIDPDDIILVEEIEERPLSDLYDFVENTFGSPGDDSRGRAVNINTLGEVPDSSWFQNRHGRARMSLEALRRGPDSPRTKVALKPWTVIAAKTEGVTPGFTVRNVAGEVFFVKFDPLSNPQMATAAEIISTKFFYAMGYHVPENYLVFAGPDDLEVHPEAKVTVTGGGERAMVADDLEDIFRRVHRGPDGTYRAVASKRLEGRPVGPFLYYGTRPDDPNDVFPHEHRRELRGLWVLSSWLNHDDSRAINTLDMVVDQGGRRFVKHYLLDFGSTLGSGSTGPQVPRAGFEYMWETKPTVARMLSFGLWDRSWIRAKYPDYPAVGRFESEQFEPHTWKPEYPNPAFLRCDAEDAYWAAKLVMRFNADEIRAIVREGRISDPEAEEYLIQTLLARRAKIGEYWLNRVNSFDGFRLESGQLSFDHLASRYGLAQEAKFFEAQWFRFDNETRESIALTDVDVTSSMQQALPTAVIESGDGSYFYLSLRLPRAPDMELRTVKVYLRRHHGELEIVGIEREP